jgi:hypothetical protein
MLARTILGSLLLCGVGCFAEPVTDTGEQCVDGTPGCDCRTGDACDAELECVISIDKCVPLDCRPGALTCTCTDAGGCSGSLVCDGGVCLEPQTGTTGHGTGIADDSNAGPEGGSTPGGSSSDTPGTLSTTGLPTTTLTTDTVESSATDLTDATLSGDTGTTEVAPIDCAACLDTAATGSCSAEYSMCIADGTAGGCAELQQCILEDGGPIAKCCSTYPDFTGHLNWNAFALCADAMECMAECTSSCPASPFTNTPQL